MGTSAAGGAQRAGGADGDDGEDAFPMSMSDAMCIPGGVPGASPTAMDAWKQVCLGQAGPKGTGVDSLGRGRLRWASGGGVAAAAG